MVWNWQKKEWPQFEFDPKVMVEWEARFLKTSGHLNGSFTHLPGDDKTLLTIETISHEALKTSEIEGEYLNRDSLQSSIRKKFGLATNSIKVKPAEQGIANMMMDLYKNYALPLTHQVLFNWHTMLMQGNNELSDVGSYRTHTDAMQIVSGAMQKRKVHFEAPPSHLVPAEMEAFIQWFNNTAPGGKSPLSAITRAGIAHLYFVSIHPFEDGNGRLARALIIKVLSQHAEQPLLTSLSYTIQKNRKLYYDALEENNKDCAVTPWLLYFAKTITDAQLYTQQLVDFIIEKGKLYTKINGQLNERQQKALARMFEGGPDSFAFGLNAEKYISITGTSRATATRDLQDMVDKKVFTKTGELKATRYHLNIPA